MLNVLYGLQHGRRKLGLLANTTIAFVIFFLLYTTTKSGSAQSYTKNIVHKLYGEEQNAVDSSKYDLYTLETLNLTHLKKYRLSPNFLYSRRIIHAKYVAEERKSLTDVGQPLFKQSSKVAYKALESFQRRQDLPLELQVSVPQSVSGAHTLSFGIATPIHRLLDSLPQLMHWLPNTGAMLHVVCPADPRTNNVTEHIRNLGINITIIESYDRFPINYFSLLPLLYHTRLPSTKWLALIDDDTFFPDLGYLLAHLEARYNPKLPQVISGVSDDIVQIKKHGLMPFGGGGIFLSVPFAAMIVDNNYPGTAGAVLGGQFPTPPNPTYSPFGPPMDHNETEKTESSEGYPSYNYIIDPNSPYRHSTAYKNCLGTEKYEGDQILSDCINKQTKVRPQYDIDLHQLDLKGDTSGFFESGRRSLTIHHWKTWFEVDIPSVASVTKICGKDCFLQRFRFKPVDSQRYPDETWVLNNGYSITKYPNGIKGLSKDLPPPPPPPPEPPAPVASEVPDSAKEPVAAITANPRFLRPKTSTWTEWPDLHLGEEVVYEGVLGRIVEKPATKGKGGLPEKKKDPYKGFGNLEWVPINQPFATGEVVDAVPVVNPEFEESIYDELRKHDANASSDAGPVWVPIDAKKEADAKVLTDQPPTEVPPKNEAVDPMTTEAQPPPGPPNRLVRRDTEPGSESDWIPVSEADITPGTRVSEISAPINPYTDHQFEVMRQTQEDELEDERKFWSGIEKTWEGEADRFEHAMGPLRRELKIDEEVVRFFMVESEGGWGDPGQQDTEVVMETLMPQRLIKGFEGDPSLRKAEPPLYAKFHGLGDPGFEGLWGEEKPPPPSENESPQDPSIPSPADANVTSDPNPSPPIPEPQTDAPGPKLVPFNKTNSVTTAAPSPPSKAKSKRFWWSSSSEEDNWSSTGNMVVQKDGSTRKGGIGGVDRTTVEWVRQTYVRRRQRPGGFEDGKEEDEVIELVWIRQ